ncbi:MAG TPA: hypothetical protein PK370_02570 [Candidatus Woesebacteria bacterium]|nr:hypothetical protein [Candidatus Woesebacteria bacterium]HPJ17103.1 hypothetical protein [Candidatus Woesebacteria bacterium]
MNNIWKISTTCLLIIVSILLYLLLLTKTPPTATSIPTPTSIPTSTPTPKIEPTSIPTLKPVINGSSINNIKYQLPSNWKAQIRDNHLYLSPNEGGGYLSIGTYSYQSDIGRREYYCQIRQVCINETTFTSLKIGNISGYLAQSIDNSGGGSEYFGAKGDKFYVINTYNPPLPNEFHNNYQKVLDSLIF